jgi:uncharacterized protein YbjT (DUF2867 family)
VSIISYNRNLPSQQILIAGASGAVGREVLRQARDAGYWIRAHSRTTANYTPLAAEANDVVIADLTNPLPLEGIARDVDIVVSLVGAPVSLTHPEKRSYREIDFVCNRNLLDQAIAAQVRRFVYVGVHTGPGYDQTAYVRAHEAFVDKLARSNIDYTVIRPTGIFVAFLEMLAYAKLGFVPVVGDGHARTNPIHEADVAQVCVEHIESGPRDVPCGGPQVFSRRQIAGMMFEAAGKKPRVFSMPKPLFRMLGAMSSLGSPRKRELLEFTGAVATSNSVAPRVGTQQLSDYLAGHILQR